MLNQSTPIENKNRNFFYLFLLTGAFLLLEISFFIQSNQIYLADFNFVSNKLHIPLSILPGLFYFILVQFSIHLLYCGLIWTISWLMSDLLCLHEDNQFFLAIFNWCAATAGIFLANQYFYPNSKFAELTAYLFFNQQLLILFLFILMAYYLLSLFLCSVMLAIISRRFVRANKRSSFLLAGLFFLVLTDIFLFKPSHIAIHDAATKEKPNIIIIGVDAVRPDFLSYFGYEKSTPFFDAFLNQATVFAEALTPLARTFPSWSGILSGEYPRQLGIRFDLANQTQVDTSVMLPMLLKKHGYATLYATDETRFSNIDKNYGFDTIITPPIGLNDFLLGTFNDFPLSNLLVNTPMGKVLFPHSYGNRPAYITYNPDSFLNLLRPSLFTQRTKPLFFSIHFCLPHFPYLWASFPGQGMRMQAQYEASILRVDAQLKAFFALLEASHLLDHAIVVLLSDHGEAFDFAGDRITAKELYLSGKGKNTSPPAFYPPSLADEAVDESAGHGTDVLGLPQYHSLLAFRLYHLGPQQPSTLTGIVSLLDIKPTILQLLGFKANAAARLKSGTGESFAIHQNISLADLIKTKKPALTAHQHFFLESDYSPEAIRTVYPQIRDVVLNSVQMFQVDPLTTRLTFKTSMGEMIIHSKQFADIYDHWMLALYPQAQHIRVPILVNLASGEWTDNLNSSFALHSPAATMLAALKSFYGSEIERVE